MTGTSKKDENEYVYINNDYKYEYDYNSNVTHTVDPSIYTTPYVTTGGSTTTPYTITTDGTTGWGFGSDDVQTKILERLEAIEKRLSIIPELSDRENEALEDAYNHYKFIEKLCEGEDNDVGKEDSL